MPVSQGDWFKKMASQSNKLRVAVDKETIDFSFYLWVAHHYQLSFQIYSRC